MLKVIEGKWDIQNLKTLVGSQCTIYIRPIQRNIIMPTNVPEENEIKEECCSCKKTVLLINLRSHLDECEGSMNVSDTDLPDLEEPVRWVNNDVQVVNEVTANLQQEASFVNNDVQVVNEVTDNLQQNAQEGFVVQVENRIVQYHEEFVNDIFNVVLNYSVSDIVKRTAEFSTQNNISNPVEILRLFQKDIVTGRKLDIENEADPLFGNTNFIMIDRTNCLQTALEEIGSIEDPRLCLEVQFFGEVRLMVSTFM